MSFEFVDGNGTRWMVLPGLPATHPEEEESALPPFFGFTFRSQTGELRVLPPSVLRQRARSKTPADVGQLLRRMSKLPALTSEHWAQLLQKAVPWPSMEPGFPRF